MEHLVGAIPEPDCKTCASQLFFLVADLWTWMTASAVSNKDLSVLTGQPGALGKKWCERHPSLIGVRWEGGGVQGSSEAGDGWDLTVPPRYRRKFNIQAPGVLTNWSANGPTTRHTACVVGASKVGYHGFRVIVVANQGEDR